MSATRTKQAIVNDIVRTFGYLPSIFTQCGSLPILESMWKSTRTAYLDNPLPRPLLDKLMAYLARFCGISYCLVVHSCCLVKIGMTPEEVFDFIDLPLPSDADMASILARLDQESTPLREMPATGSALEAALIRCVIGIYSGHPLAEDALPLLARVLGKDRYAHLTLFTGWASSLFVWVDAHPVIRFEDNSPLQPALARLLSEEPRLGEIFAEHAARSRRERVMRGAQVTAAGLLDATLAASPVAFALLDREKRLRRGNPALAALSGKTSERLLGSPLVEVFPESAGLLETLTSKVFASGSPILGLETSIGTPDGPRDWLLNAFAVRDVDGHIANVGVLITDVAGIAKDRRRARVLARERLRQRQWIETILNLTPTPLMLVDSTTSSVSFANRAARALAGRDEFAVWSGPDALLSRIAREQQLCDLETDWPSASASKTVLINSARAPQAFDRPETIVVTIEDVTRLKQIERDLQAAVRIREDFVAIASHELRTPTTTIGLQAEALAMMAESGGASLDPARFATKARDIQRQVRRLDRLVTALLDVVRLRELRLRAENVDMVATVRDVLKRFEDDLARAGSTVTLRGPLTATGRWDRDRIEQIVTNLLTNALKFGKGRPIDVVVEMNDAIVRLVVSDCGVGIPLEVQGELFSGLERVVSPRSYGGLGLGLWIVREIVKAHRGSVAVDSRPGAGARFIVELPRRS
jgi:signal transduction histidine kinase